MRCGGLTSHHSYFLIWFFNVPSSLVTCHLKHSNFFYKYFYFETGPFYEFLILTSKIEFLQSYQLVFLSLLKSLEQSRSKEACRLEEAHKMAERDIATDVNRFCMFISARNVD